MPATNFSFFETGGALRLRACLAPHDPKNLSLDPRVLTFDSAWTNVMRLVRNGVAAAGSLGTKAIGYPSTFGGLAGTRNVRVLPNSGANGPGRPTLAWMRNNGGTLTRHPAGTPVSGPGVSQSYARGYGVCAVSLTDDEIYFSPSRANMDYVYFIFGVSPTGQEATGGNGGRIGLHPLYGRGIFISRPGFDHLTCGLDDMVLSTHRNHFQIEETGTVFCNTYGGGGPNFGTDQVDGDPFPLLLGVGTLRNYGIVTLHKSYPHYPPVIAYTTDGGNQQLPSIFWLSPNQILISGITHPAKGVRYAVVASDPAYQPGADTIPDLCRIHFEIGEGIFVTKRNVDFYSAGANDFLFRTDRISPRFPDFGAIVTGASTNGYNLPAGGVPPAGAGSPFGFFLVFDGVSGWWCGCGFVQSQDIVATGGGYYDNFFRATITSRTQYLWEKNTNWTGAAYGWVAAMNVSDFG